MTSRGPSWLDTRPSVRVIWLSGRNAVRRWPRAAAVLACVFLAVGVLGRVRAVDYVIARVALSPRVVFVVTMVFAATVVLRRRQHLEKNFHAYWLAALPRDVPLAARAARGPLVQWMGAAVLIVLMSAVGQLPLWVPGSLLGYSAAGIALGIALATGVAMLRVWRMRRGARGSRATNRSSYARAAAPRAGWATRASLAPLGSCPRTASRARDRATVQARSLVLLLLAIPAGVSGGAALIAAAVWLVILHMINLLIALTRAAFSAAWWLAPTPVGPWRFALATSYLTLAAQVAACALLFAIGYVVLGPAHVRTMSALLGGWIVAMVALGTTVCVMALCTRSIAASPLHRWRE